MPAALRLPLAAAACAAALATLPAAASASSFLSVRVSGATGATAIALDTGAPASGAPTPLARATLTLPGGFRLAPRAACRRATVLLRPGRCPAAARVGGGTGRFAAYNSGARAPGGRLDAVASLSAYTGPGGTLLLRAEFARPIDQALVYDGRVAGRQIVLSLAQGDVAGYELTPAFLRLTLGGPNGSGYVRRAASCPAGGWGFSALLRYRAYSGRPPDSPLRLSGAAPCKA
jgi:hypothetical protein